MIQFLQDDLSVFLTMIVCLTIMLRYEKKKRAALPRLFLSLMAMLAFCLSINAVRNHLGGAHIVLSSIVKYTGILALTVCSVMLCYRTTIGLAMINVASAFCIEHIAQRTKSLILPHIHLPMSAKAQEILLAYALTLICIALYCLIFERRRNRSSDIFRKVDAIQVFVSVAVVCTDIVFSFSFIDRAVNTGALDMLPFGCIASILYSVLTLVISQCHLMMNQEAYDLHIVRKMLEDERVRYTRNQATVDALNIKAHDLKHQLLALQLDPDGIKTEDIYRAVEAYDAICHTGNAALDVIITNKNLICLGKRISLTRMLDGSCLSFMQDSDIYSLMGNIIDNAIDALESVQDAQRRAISLTLSAKNGMALIHEDNYYCGTLVFEDGLPKTTRQDVYSHGFGMKSIRLLVEKYGGHMRVSADGNIFSLDILIPIPAGASD